jgi:hypothetical protein
VLKPFGLPENLNGNGFNIFVSGAETGAQSSVSTSIDSGYLQVGDNYGLVALFPLLAVPFAAAWAAAKCRRSWLAIFPVAAFAVLIGLFTIGFQTQVPMFVWLLAGAASGAQRTRARTLTGGLASSAPS